MNPNFKRLILTTALTTALAAVQARPAGAQANSKSQGLTGTWTMSLIGDHVIPLGLALQQEGAALTGTLTMMGKDIPIKGDVTNGAVTLIGSANMMMRDHAQASGGGDATPPTAVGMKFIGTVQEDGTLAGELASPRGPMKWTADRLKERSIPQDSATPGSSASDLTRLVGSWNVSVMADHVTPVGLLIEQEGGKAKAILTIMGGDVPLAGEYVSGTLTLSGQFTEAVTAKSGMRGAVKVTASLKTDGSIAGEFTMAHGAFPLTGERLKDRSAKTPATH